VLPQDTGIERSEIPAFFIAGRALLSRARTRCASATDVRKRFALASPSEVEDF